MMRTSESGHQVNPNLAIAFHNRGIGKVDKESMRLCHRRPRPGHQAQSNLAIEIRISASSAMRTTTIKISTRYSDRK